MALGFPGATFPLECLSDAATSEMDGAMAIVQKVSRSTLDSAIALPLFGGVYIGAAFGLLCSARRRLMSPRSFGAAGLPHSHDAPVFGDHQIQNACRSATLVKSENEWSNIYTNNVNRHTIECQGSKTG